MFRVVQSYRWPVTVDVPADGAFEPRTFNVTFGIMGDARFNELLAGPDPDQAVLRESILNWDGVEGGDGQTLEFSPEAVGLMVDIPYIRRGLIDAFLESQRGGGAREKNSGMSPAPGLAGAPEATTNATPT